jgi:hypothetical protein
LASLGVARFAARANAHGLRLVSAPVPLLAGWAAVALALPAILVAAKAHGRQVRLERERAGFAEVSFLADNDPWVEALWQRDRRTYWPAFAAGLALGLLAAGLGGWTLPSLVLAPAVALLAGFLAAGLASLARFGRAPARAGAPMRDPAWARAARRGSAAWWAAASLACAFVAWARLA